MHAAFGAFWLGVSLPDGPPLGTGLTTKLEMFASSLMLSCFIAISGLQTNFFVIEQSHVKIIEAVGVRTVESQEVVEIQAREEEVVVRVISPLETHPASRIMQAMRNSEVSVMESKLSSAEETVFHTFVVKSSNGSDPLTREKLIAAISTIS